MWFASYVLILKYLFFRTLKIGEPDNHDNETAAFPLASLLPFKKCGAQNEF
jgi:hypothetical protein